VFHVIAHGGGCKVSSTLNFFSGMKI